VLILPKASYAYARKLRRGGGGDPVNAALSGWNGKSCQNIPGDKDDLVVKRLRLAVRAMDEAAAYAIHSFCQRALTEFAFNSGQQFQMEVLTDDRDLWRQAVQDWWRRTGYPLDPAHARLFSDSLGAAPVLRRPADRDARCADAGERGRPGRLGTRAASRGHDRRVPGYRAGPIRHLSPPLPRQSRLRADHDRRPQAGDLQFPRRRHLHLEERRKAFEAEQGKRL
jgi:hypothetical protein